MKIKQVENILKGTKYITLYNDENCQWVSDGNAVYPLYNMPWLDQESLFTMLDVPSDSRNKYTFRCFKLSTVSLNFADVVPGEKVLDRNMMTLNVKGRTIEPLKTSNGIIFLDIKYLKPFADEQSVELYERGTENGVTYIAVKSGLMLLGIIMPFDPLDDTFVEQLAELTNLSAYQWELKKQRKDAGTWQETIEWTEVNEESEDEAK